MSIPKLPSTPNISTMVSQLVQQGLSLSPTKIHVLCPRKNLFDSQSKFVNLQPLIGSPFAAMGDIYHQLLEDAHKGKIQGSVSQHLWTLAQTHRSIARVGLKPQDLPQAFPLWQKIKKSRYYVREATKIIANRQSNTASNSSSQSSVVLYSGLNKREVKLPAVSVSTVKFGGVIDHIKIHRDEVHITDDKSGSVYTYDNVLGEKIYKPEYIDQLISYAWLASQNYPTGKKFYLYLKDTDLHQMTLSGNDVEMKKVQNEGVHTFISVQKVQQLFQQHVATKIKKIEAHTQGTSISGVPDAHCQYCSWRHLCPEYLQQAQSWWQKGMDFNIPTDVWGEVRNIEIQAKQRYQITLENKVQGKSVCYIINGVNPITIVNIKKSLNFSIGDFLYFFNLKQISRVRTRLSRQLYQEHPMNNRTHLNGWTVHLFQK